MSWIWVLLCLFASVSAAEPVAHPIATLEMAAKSADIAPDGSFVAIEGRVLDQNDGKVRDVVTVWDFHSAHTATKTVLERPAERDTRTGKFYDPNTDTTYVRVAPDSKTIVAYIAGTVYVLRGKDLTVVRTFPVRLPGPKPRTFVDHKGTSHTFFTRTSVDEMEISPDGALLAVLSTRESSPGHLDIYDLATGRALSDIAIEHGYPGSYHGAGIAWSASSSAVYVACAGSTPGPDVFAFDARTGAQKIAMKSGVYVSDIAVTREEQLLAVDGNRVALFSNHHPKLHVLNAATGKHIRDIAGDPAVRYRVAASRDGRRAVAWSSDVRCAFDALDMHCDDNIVRNQFTVWSLPEFKTIARSAELPKNARALRTSADGKYTVTYSQYYTWHGKQRGYEKPAVWVFEIP